MSNKIQTVLVILLTTMMLSSMVVAPVAATDHDPGDADDEEASNIICFTNNDGDYVATNLGNLLSIATTLLVTVAGVIAVIGGAGYTLASAANPTKEEYIEYRNNSIKYGGGTLIVLYASNALIAELDENLDFGCVLPFA